MVTVGSIALSGLLRCSCSAGDEATPPTLCLGFTELPVISFKLHLEGKALSLGNDTVRAWLQRQLERWLRAQAVLPNQVQFELPSGMLATPPSPEERALQRLLALACDEGDGPRWQLSAELALAIGADICELRRRPEGAAGTPGWATPEWEWATALVLALLQLSHHERSELWEGVVEARREAMPPELMRAAMERVCALGCVMGS